jgi:hypothetical protein
VPSVKSENVFGLTYGKTSYMSNAGKITKGVDEPVNIRYKTMFKNEYVEHNKVLHETAAQIVGVQRGEDAYKKV